MGKTRIAALGDSLTKGVVLTDRNRYSVLENCFIDIIGERKNLDIENFGKFGCTVEFGNKVIDRHSDKISTSAITFLEYGGNDCDFDWMKIAEAPSQEHKPKTTLESFKEQFYTLIERVRSLGSRPVIISLPPIDSERYFSFLSRFMNEEQKKNVIKWLGNDIGIISRWHEMYNKALFEIAGTSGSNIIDITSPFEAYDGDIRSLYCPDGIHPNAEGHRLIAGSISKFDL